MAGQFEEYMKMLSKDGYTFRRSANTGGKAGKGHNATRSIHVVGPIRGRYFTYRIDDVYGCDKAIKKAIAWIEKDKLKELNK